MTLAPDHAAARDRRDFAEALQNIFHKLYSVDRSRTFEELICALDRITGLDGGHADAFLWSQLDLQHLDGDASAAVQEALALSRERLVSCDTTGQWTFVMPLGELKEAGQDD